MNRKTRKIVLIFISVALFCAGLYVLLKPIINNYIYEIHAESIVELFYQTYWPTDKSEERLEDVPDTLTSTEAEPEPTKPLYPELYAAMQAYNDEIYEEKQVGLADPWCYTAQVINLSDYGVEGETIGVLSIPKIEYEAPVFLGATYAHLDEGAAQLSISSMPIGGINTNCVLAAHRGWYGADHMRRIDALEIGDTVTLTTFWDILQYKVVEIKIIEPYQAEELLIQEGRELLTLVTCHPYGSGGAQRYVVYCERQQPDNAMEEKNEVEMGSRKPENAD